MRGRGLVLAALVVAGGAAFSPSWGAPKPRAIARLAGLDGKALGTAEFHAVNRGIIIEFDLHDLPPGPHALHLHTSGNCDPKTNFTSAGPILTLIPGKQHGYLAKGGPEAGDLPNQFAGPDGRLHASVLATGFNLGNGKALDFRPGWGFADPGPAGR